MADRKNSAMNVPLKPLDELFEPTVKQNISDGITQSTLPLDALHPFEKHPFRLYTEERMNEMVESVKEYGVISPILVRPKKEGNGYEIISGHNRVEACRRAGITEIPATVRDLDDDTATILMVDSNLKQREKLLPSEKAKAYQMKMDAVTRKMGRPKKGGQLDHTLLGKKSRDLIGEEAGDSGKQVSRYIRLNNLIPALLDYVDEGKLSFNPAVEISYLAPEDQEIVFEIMDRDEVAPSLSQAQKLHRLSAVDKIDDSAIEAVMLVEKPMYSTIIFRRNTLEKYFPEGTSGQEIEQTILRLLDNMQKERENKKSFDMER